MICLAREFDTEEDHPGVIVLQQWLAKHGHDGEEPPAPGTDAISTLGLGKEVLETNVTPGRGHCFAMRGVVREYSYSTDARFISPVDATNTGLHPDGVADTGQSDYDIVVPEDPHPIHGHPGRDRCVVRLVRDTDPDTPSPTRT